MRVWIPFIISVDLISDADFWRTDYSSEPDHLYKYSVRPVRPFLSESYLEHSCPTMQNPFAIMSSSIATLVADSLSVNIVDNSMETVAPHGATVRCVQHPVLSSCVPVATRASP